MGALRGEGREEAPKKRIHLKKAPDSGHNRTHGGDMELGDSVRCVLDQKGWGAFSVSPYQTVFEALEAMAKEGVGALVVVQGEVLAGVFSERDYARRVILEGRSSRDALVADIMTADVITVTPDVTVDRCMHLMTEHRIRHLPVMVCLLYTSRCV